MASHDGGTNKRQRFCQRGLSRGVIGERPHQQMRRYRLENENVGQQYLQTFFTGDDAHGSFLLGCGQMSDQMTKSEADAASLRDRALVLALQSAGATVTDEDETHALVYRAATFLRFLRDATCPSAPADPASSEERQAEAQAQPLQ